MSTNFSANQYEQTFHPTSLQNWEVPKGFGRHPRAKAGSTRIISNNKGHLLPGVSRSRECPWGSHVGTWDLPLNIPGNQIINHTARAEHAINNFYSLKASGDLVLSGKLKKSKVPDPLPVVADIEADQRQRTPITYASGAVDLMPPTSADRIRTPITYAEDPLIMNNEPTPRTPITYV